MKIHQQAFDALKLTKKIKNVMGRAALDMNVGPKAMEMLRYYALDYEYMHGNDDGSDFQLEVERFAIPSNDLQDLMGQWDGKKSNCFKGPFRTQAEAIQMRVFELNYMNLSNEPVKLYWYELNAAVLQYLKT